MFAQCLDNEFRINEIKHQLLSSGKGFGKNLDNKIDVLENLNGEMKRSIAEYQWVSIEKWDTFNRHFNRKMKELNRSIDEFE